MKVLITGATGMVGRALVPQLLAQGHSVNALVRDPRKAGLPAAVKVFAWDGLSGPPAVEAVDGVEAVFHLAGENVAGQRWTEKRKKALRDSRVVTAENLRLGLMKAGIKLKFFHSASGVGFYGNRGDEILSETEQAGTDFLARLCVEWEAAADRMPAERILKTRMGVVLQKGGGFLGQVIPLFKKLGASRLGDGRQWMPWIHMDDMLRVLLQALEDGRMSGVINAVAPQPVTNKQVTQDLGKAVGAWSGPPAPQFALKLMYGELAEALLFSQRAKPEKLQQLGFKFKFPEFQQAIEQALK